MQVLSPGGAERLISNAIGPIMGFRSWLNAPAIEAINAMEKATMATAEEIKSKLADLQNEVEQDRNLNTALKTAFAGLNSSLADVRQQLADLQDQGVRSITDEDLDEISAKIDALKDATAANNLDEATLAGVSLPGASSGTTDDTSAVDSGNGGKSNAENFNTEDAANSGGMPSAMEQQPTDDTKGSDA